MFGKFIVFACLSAIPLASSADNEVSKIPPTVDDKNAKPGEFPHQVSIQMMAPTLMNVHICGGSIINEQWVLTAARCIRTYEMAEYDVKDLMLIVKAGKYNLNVTEPNEQVLLVESYFRHENYTDGTSPNDIALLQLISPLNFNKLVAPARLPKKGSEPSGKVILSGWGAINNNTNNSINPRILQKAELEIINHTTCVNDMTKAYEEKNKTFDQSMIDETNICTGRVTKGVGACIGDSGGPLIRKDNNGNVEVVGILSWTISPCERTGVPDVYVEVSSFIDWIENFMSKYSKNFTKIPTKTDNMNEACMSLPILTNLCRRFYLVIFNIFGLE